MRDSCCKTCGAKCDGQVCRSCYQGHAVAGPRVCGFPNCGLYGPSLDQRYGRLCTRHNARLRRHQAQGHTEEEAYRLIDTTAPGKNSVVLTEAADLDLIKVKDRVCDSRALTISLRPLLLFKGNLSEGRVTSLYNLLASAKDREVNSMTAITKATQLLTDPVHYCGLHTTWTRAGMIGFISRMLQSPSVLMLESDWKDYLHFLAKSSKAYTYTLAPISGSSHRTRRHWRQIYRTTLAPMAEHYPFITGKPSNDHDLILAVDGLVPKYFPSDVRADICQDMVVAILTGETSLENLRDAPSRYIKDRLRQAPSRYGHISLDAPVMSGDSRSRTLAEMLI
jgi:hypothetical protein